MEIAEKLKSLDSLFKKNNVVFAYLFGSQTRGEVGRLSDVDVAVYFDKSLDKKERKEKRYRIQEELEEAFDFQVKADVIPLNDAHPLLEREVVYGGVRVYSGDDTKRKHYEAGAVSRWLDWKYYQNKLDSAIKKEINKSIKSRYAK
jgi:hypothetical protein